MPPTTLGELKQVVNTVAVGVAEAMRCGVKAITDLPAPSIFHRSGVPEVAALLARYHVFGPSHNPEALETIRADYCRRRGVTPEEADATALIEVTRAIVPPVFIATFEPRKPDTPQILLEHIEWEIRNILDAFSSNPSRYGLRPVKFASRRMRTVNPHDMDNYYILPQVEPLLDPRIVLKIADVPTWRPEAETQGEALQQPARTGRVRPRRHHSASR